MCVYLTIRMGVNFVNSFNLKCVSFLFGTMMFLNAFPLTSGCSVQHKRKGDSALLQFQATTVSSEDPVLLVTNVIKSPTGSTLLTVLYRNGNLRNTPDCNNCTFTGDATTGNLDIRLDNLKASNGGSYKLEVDGKDKQGQCIILFTLGVPTKPTITSNRAPSVGENVTLTCSSTSTTTPNSHGLTLSYNWTVDGTVNPTDSRYSYSANRNTLTLTNVNKKDANKRFTCTATEDVNEGYTSNSSDSFSANVLYGPEELAFDPSGTHYEEEENVTLSPVTCASECNPSCTYMWKNVDKGTIVSGSAVLTLDVLKSSQAGTYQCTATRSGTYSLTKNLTVNVIYGPRQMKFSPETTTYKEDEYSNIQDITCSSDCYECEYSWTGPSAFSSRLSVLSLGRINRTMAGTYICTAKNTKSSKQAEQRKDLKVDVRYGPDFVRLTPGDSRYFVNEGTRINDIQCIADCFPTCTYKWTKEGQSTPVSETDILTLGTAQRSHTGNYTCTAVNGETSAKPVQTTVSFVVRYAPDVRTELSTTNITEGANLTLFCKGSGVPSVYNYVSLTQTWNKLEINNANKELADTMKYSSIHFNHLQLQDSGTYTCTLNNGIENKSGILNQASSENLLVKVRPKILRRDFNFAGVTKGEVSIQVPVYSYPNFTSISVTRYDGMVIKSDNKYDLSIHQDNVTSQFYNTKVTLSGSVISFTIRDLEESDFGNYTMWLTNSLDSTSSTLYVIAEGKPSPPKIFQFLQEYDVPTFIWQKDFNGGPEQSFVIQTSISGTDDWKNHTHIHEKDSRYKMNETFYLANITGLQPGVYTARIYATNEKGDSGFVSLNQTFEISKNEEDSGTKLPVAAIAGGSASAILVIVIMAIVVLVLRRRAHRKDESRTSLNSKSRNGNGLVDENDEDIVNTVNPIYVSADEVQPTDNTYAQPVKKTKIVEEGQTYALVNKQALKGKQKDKTDKANIDKDIYENAPELSRQEHASKNHGKHVKRKAQADDLNTNPGTNKSEKRTNKDGLIYLDLMFSNEPKGQKKLVIHGREDQTEYVQVDFTKKADPLPDSDDEDTKNKS